MLELVFSNRAEALIEVLAERVAARQAGDGFWQPVPIIVPNPLVERFVKEGLADRNGAAANLHFHFLESWVGQALGAERRLWTPEAITGRLLARFEDEGALDAEVSAYLRGAGRDRKALQLAQRLGHLFLEYALHRPDWVSTWRSGREAGGAHWQGRLFAEVDRSLAQAGFVCPTDLAKEALQWVWPQGAFVVSLNSLAPAYLALLERLRESVDLTFLVLNPCEDFWADHAARKDFLAGGEPPEGHPALGLWGRPGRDFMARLYDLAEGQDETRFQSPGRTSILRALQDDILALRVPQAVEGNLDRSLRVLAAPGPRREAEVVAGEIWRLLADHREDATPMRFSDIAVVIPAGEATAYQEHLRAAFESTGRLPLAFESALTGAVPLLSEACGLLLDLLGSDASRAAVLRFLGHPASRARHPDLDIRAVLDLCERTGLLRGLDDEDFQGTYLAGRDRLHWEQGLTRTALGAFLPDDRSIPGRDLPAAAPPDRAAALALAALIRDLCAWREQRARQFGPLAWVDAFMDLVEAHLGNEEEAWVRARAKVRSRLTELARLAPEPLPVPQLSFEQARDLMGEKLAQLDDRPEGGGGIRVSTGMPMRAVPFRAVFIMGLEEGLFPAVERGDPLDLRQRGERRSGDLGRAEQDRYLFLELLLSARDYLRLSYASADPLTGDARPRSAVLEELMDLLQAMTGDAEALVERHPLRRFDAGYFQKSGLRSLAPEAAREASALATGRAEPPPVLPAPAFPPEVLRLPLARLRDWLEEPVQGAARIRLGLRGEDEDTAADATEPITLGRLETAGIERAAVDAMLDGVPADAALAQAWRSMELEGRAPLGPLGEPSRTAIRICLAAWSPVLEKAGPFRVPHFGETQPALDLDIPLEGRMVRVSLHGRGELVAPSGFLALSRKQTLDGTTLLRARIRMRLSQLVMAASGESVPGLLTVVDAGGESETLLLAPPTVEAARAQVIDWVRALLVEAPAQRLPATFALERDRSDPQRWLDAKDRSRFVASWGPVPLSILRRYPAPPTAEAEAQLRFRLGPLFPEREEP